MAAGTRPTAEPTLRYAAFISYRHVEPDRRWATWLHRSLETYRVPKALREAHGLPPRIGRVFRDEEELSASSDLSHEIEEALRQSGHLIVVCSPRTPSSEWVNQEVARFREMGRGDRILALLIEGEPADSFPASLREIRKEVVAEGGRADVSVETVEPLAADVRPLAHESRGHLRQFAKLRLLSSVLGVRFDDLRRREQQRLRTRRLAWTVTLAMLTVAFAGLALFALGKQREAVAERDAKAQALDEVLRLSDSKVARDLVAEVETLWPIRSDRADAMAAWLDRARTLVAQRARYETALSRLREEAQPYPEADRMHDHAQTMERIAAIEKRRAEITEILEAFGNRRWVRWEGKILALKALLEEQESLRGELRERETVAKTRVTWRFPTEVLAWRHEVLREILAALDRIIPPSGEEGLMADVEARHRRASTLRDVSIRDHESVWTGTIEEIAASSLYTGLRIRPQEGLVPIGPDPTSGLFEFAHVGSGSFPVRDPESGRLQYEDDAAIVFVLLPGGTFRMGAQRTDPSRTNHDPDAKPDEAPVHEVTVSPCFLGKHELTQAQWLALAPGPNPSGHKAGTRDGGRRITPRNPVEEVSWQAVSLWLGRHGLALPTEAQWEYACRAGTATAWHTGLEAASLQGYANVLDRRCMQRTWCETQECTKEIDDGYVSHAPVGSYLPNGFGLYDMHGNVAEWCRDGHGDYVSLPVTDPVHHVAPDGVCVQRGGQWQTPASSTRSAARNWAPQGFATGSIGVRPARVLGR